MPGTILKKDGAWKGFIFSVAKGVANNGSTLDKFRPKMCIAVLPEKSAPFGAFPTIPYLYPPEMVRKESSNTC